MLGFLLTCAIVVTRLPNTSRCRRKIQVLASHNRPVLSSFFSGFAGSRVVSGIERQSVGDRANQSCHV